MEFELRLATAADDPDIRRLLRSMPMPGTIRVTFAREPDFFAGSCLLSRSCQVLIARHQPTGELAGLICRSIRRAFVGGEPRLVGYLSGLRIAPRFQGRWLLSRGARFLRELHGDGQVQTYFAAIIDGNRVARRLLVERPRRHFPAFRPLGGLVTLALPLRPGRGLGGREEGRAAPCTDADLPELIAFLHREGARRQLFPALEASDFGTPTTAGLRPSDFLAVREGGRVAATVALWDQSAFKQSVIDGYPPALALARPAYNLWARLTGTPALPAPGERLREVYAALLAVADDRPDLFGALLPAAARLAARRGADYLLLGLSERDPLLPLARRWRHIAYRSELYAVGWEEDAPLDDRIPYVEIASL